MKKDFSSILRIDKIRTMKLLEMCQFAVIGLILGSLNGLFISKYVIIKYNEDNYINEKYPRKHGNRNPLLWFHLIIDMCIITITTYFLKKLALIIPFFFGFLDKKYISGLKNEGVTGFTVGLGFVYLRVLVNFQSRLSLLLDSIVSS